MRALRRRRPPPPASEEERAPAWHRRSEGPVGTGPGPLAGAGPVLTARGPVQTKRDGGGDGLEREADAAADRVVAGHTAPALTPVPAGQGAPQREADGTRPNGPVAQAGGTPGAASALGAGAPLPDGVRGPFERRFGEPLDDIRVHTGPEAAASSAALGARAFTAGRDVAFGAGMYRPESPDGRRLIAHETAHVVQQRKGGVLGLQRSPLSDSVRDVWKKSANELDVYERLSRPDARAGAADPDLAAELARIFPTPEERWMAERILNGELGKTRGIASKKIAPSPVKAFFIRGVSDERALVVAGVHGTERQGMDVAERLLADLQKTQPHYSVVLVPSLFPDNAAYGSTGRREDPAAPTNRNFPAEGKTVGEATKDTAGDPLDALGDKILPENVMLMTLMERFHPSRVISIHGTWDPKAAGIFADPHPVTPAKKAEAAVFAPIISTALGLVGPLGAIPPAILTPVVERMLLARAKGEADARTKEDADLAVAAAFDVDKRAAGLTTPPGRFSDKASKAHPSVAGNRLDPATGTGKATWGAASPKGVSLGGYAPQRGVSIFT
ncbi:MAG TPA: DUF4157 domain-containing protein, partial [Rhodothermales bacterium]|nr:DUF4157 domain-containing protein [Rhodothermales bacterium]